MVYVSGKDANYLELPAPGGSGSGKLSGPQGRFISFPAGGPLAVVSFRGLCRWPVQGPCVTVGGEAETQGGGSTARILAPGLRLPHSQAKALAATGQAKEPGCSQLGLGSRQEMAL